MYLLDTHTLLWFMMDDPKQPDGVKSLMESDGAFFVSIASFWEIAIKNAKGRLILPGSIPFMAEACLSLGFQILPIRPQHLDKLKNLPDIHADPFDRLLICQALAEDLTVLTADGNIPRYPVRTLWN